MTRTGAAPVLDSTPFHPADGEMVCPPPHPDQERAADFPTRTYSFVVERKRKPNIPKTLGLIGFIGTGWLILLVVLEDAIARRGRPWEALEIFLLGAVHCPFLAIVAAAVGVGLGIWIEILIGLIRWRPGKSLMLTLAENDEDDVPETNRTADEVDLPVSTRRHDDDLARVDRLQTSVQASSDDPG